MIIWINVVCIQYMHGGGGGEGGGCWCNVCSVWMRGKQLTIIIDDL